MPELVKNESYLKKVSEEFAKSGCSVLLSRGLTFFISVYYSQIQYNNVTFIRRQQLSWFQVAPSTIHPAFEKAAHYFNLKMKHVPVNPTTIQSDLSAYEREIDSNTILLLASAPSYPQVRSVNFFCFYSC